MLQSNLWEKSGAVSVYHAQKLWLPASVFICFATDEGLTLETLALKLFTVANLRYSTQLIIPNYLVIPSHQHCTTVFFRNFPPFILLFSYSFSYKNYLTGPTVFNDKTFHCVLLARN